MRTAPLDAQTSHDVQSKPTDPDADATTSCDFCYWALAICSSSILWASAFVGLALIFYYPNSYWILRRPSKIGVPGLYFIGNTSGPGRLLNSIVPGCAGSHGVAGLLARIAWKGSPYAHRFRRPSIP